MTDDAETLRYEATPPAANMIRAAKSHQERAQILLQLSDAALLGCHVEIHLECRAAQFAGGDMFLTWRIAALCRTRDAHGLLPDAIALELEAWRLTLSRIAAGVAPLTLAPARADREEIETPHVP